MESKELHRKHLHVSIQAVFCSPTLTIWGSLELKSKIYFYLILSLALYMWVMWCSPPGVLWPMHTAFTRGPKDVHTRIFPVGTGQDLGLSSPSGTKASSLLAVMWRHFSWNQGYTSRQDKAWVLSLCQETSEDTVQWKDHHKLDFNQSGSPSSASIHPEQVIKPLWKQPGGCQGHCAFLIILS